MSAQVPPPNHDLPHPSPQPWQAPVKPKRPVVLITTVCLLAVVSVALGSLSAYLWTTSRAWEERSDQLVVQNRKLADALATSNAELEVVNGDLELASGLLDEFAVELDTLSGELTDAQNRIRGLANEKAKAGDEREYQRQLVDYQRRVSIAATEVADAFASCVRSKDELIGALYEREYYDPAALNRFANDVDRYCDDVQRANNRLKDELNK